MPIKNIYGIAKWSREWVIFTNGYGSNPTLAPAVECVEESERKDIVNVVAHVRVENHRDGIGCGR